MRAAMRVAIVVLIAVVAPAAGGGRFRAAPEVYRPFDAVGGVVKRGVNGLHGVVDSGLKGVAGYAADTEQSSVKSQDQIDMKAGETVAKPQEKLQEKAMKVAQDVKEGVKGAIKAVTKDMVGIPQQETSKQEAPTPAEEIGMKATDKKLAAPHAEEKVYRPFDAVGDVVKRGVNGVHGVVGSRLKGVLGSAADTEQSSVKSQDQIELKAGERVATSQGKLQEKAMKIAQDVKEGVANTQGKLQEKATKIAQDVKEGVASSQGKLQEKAMKIAQNVKDGVKGAIKAATKDMVGIPQ